jgi:Plasmid encoded RepA protein
MVEQKNTYPGLSVVDSRMRSSAVDILTKAASIDDAIFQHSVLCQTFLPYRNPGNEQRIWKHKQGHVSLAIQANETINPQTGEFEFIGLPYGPKARLILAHINSQAVKTQSKLIDVEASMTAFIKKIGLNTDGKTIREVKEQLRRISTSIVSMGYAEDNRSVQVDLKIVKAFDLWFPKDSNQRVLWSSVIQLSDDYFESLLTHAIPLDERALSALSHNSMALDIYAWLVQRLHRVDPSKPQFVSWQNLKEQFGNGYGEMWKFKQVFRKTLNTARLQYPQAHLAEDKNKGFNLYSSPPPIPLKTISIPKKITK